jgi:UDP-2-acetamido-3-amino-2,3-dideoxy-glucuronate N-acetyltransferase
MHQDRLGVAVVGLGPWGENLARVFAGLDRARVVALCDERPDRLAALPELGDGPLRTRCLGEAIALDATAAVVIATAPASHAQLAGQALSAGKHVFIEKPMARCSDDARQLMRHAERAGLRIMVGHILEYHPAFERLRELVEAGRLGRLSHIRCQRLGRSARRHESVWWSLAPHDLGLLRVLAGAEPQRLSVCARDGAPDDAVVAQLQFPGELSARIEVSAVHPDKTRRLTVVGTERIAVFDDQEPRHKLRLFEPAPRRLGQSGCPYPDSPDCLGALPTVIGLRCWPVDVDRTEPLEREARHFVDALLDGRPIRTDAANGLAVVELLEMGQQSLECSAREVAARPHRPREPPLVPV